MNKKLFVQAATKYVLGLILVSLPLFISAGTLSYWNAWVFIGILFIPILFVGIILMIKNPELLRKRLNAKEKETEQRTVILTGIIMFLGGFVVAGLDFRYQWLSLPRWLIISAIILHAFGYLLYAETLRENVYLSRTVEIQENQRVIDTGLYGIVRHPMYLSSMILFLSVPLVLGSLFSFIIFLIYPVLMVKRIISEERMLEKGLVGYKEYKKKVRYRLFPFIW